MHQGDPHGSPLVDRTLPAAALGLTCLLSSACHGGLVEFEDLTVGTRYFSGETFTSSGIEKTVSGTGNGWIDVQSLGQAGGTGNELEFFGGSGGQELVLDTVSFTTVPAPAGLAILGLALAGPSPTGRRRRPRVD